MEMRRCSFNPLTPELPQHGFRDLELPDTLFLTVFLAISKPIFRLYENKL